MAQQNQQHHVLSTAHITRKHTLTTCLHHPQIIAELKSKEKYKYLQLTSRNKVIQKELEQLQFNRKHIPNSS